MDLKNNTIKVSEIIANPAAKALLKKEFPEVMNPLMLGIARSMTLAEVLRHAQGRYSDEKIKRVLTELQKI